MKHLQMCIYAAILSLCGLGFLTSCSDDQDNNKRGKPLSEAILGRWQTVEYDGEPAITDEKAILNFVSPTTCYMNMLLADNEEKGGWGHDIQFDMQIKGYTLTLFGIVNDDIAAIYEMQFTSVKANTMVCKMRTRTIVKGEEREDAYTVKFVRASATTDYNEQIVGIWEADYWEDAVFTRCRYEFKDDGTYSFYYLDAQGQWQLAQDDYSYFFCDDNLVYMRWKNTGKEPQCECWDIKRIDQGVMTWHFRRSKGEGTAERTVEFTKVQN